MKRQHLLILGAFVGLFLGLLSANRAEAQLITNPGRSYGVGSGSYAGPPYAGPSIGVFPSAYPGYYGNGTGGYGPRAQTVGAVPESSGRLDHRFTNTGPFFGTGLGWFGKRSPSPRPKPNFNYNPTGIGSTGSTGEPPLLDDSAVPMNPNPVAPVPVPVPDGPAPLPIGNPEAVESGSLLLEVRLPNENATVFVNNQSTRQAGTVRTFASPSLPKAETYEYDIRAEWLVAGKKVSRTKTVTGKPGERVVADFGR